MKAVWRLVLALGAVLAASGPAFAQIQPCRQISGVETQNNQPPAGSAPVYRCAQVMVHGAGDRVTEVEPMIDPYTYGGRLTPAWSLVDRNQWKTYDESIIQADFWKLWRTEFLEDEWIQVIDEPFPNGVIGKHVVFHLEERARLKVVDYLPLNEKEKLKVEVSKIESTLKEKDIAVRLDSFVDESTLRKVIGTIKELYADQGFNDAVVTTQRQAMPAGPKLVHLTFRIDPGPRVEIAELSFDGNSAFTDAKLRKQMKDNKPKGFLGFLGDATYHELKFSDDAGRIAEFYKDHGYAGVQVGQPQTEVLRTSPDGKRRWIRLRVPIDEGMKYTIGTFELTGETKLNLVAIRNLYKIKEGDVFSNELIRKGIEKTKEAYGAYGFWQWSYDPELKPRGIDPTTGKPIGDEPPPPIMDVSIRMEEGKQFFVNRITFTGNTNTHDAVIRREMRLAEGGVFNAEALKESVR